MRAELCLAGFAWAGADWHGRVHAKNTRAKRHTMCCMQVCMYVCMYFYISTVFLLLCYKHSHTHTLTHSLICTPVFTQVSSLSINSRVPAMREGKKNHGCGTAMNRTKIVQKYRCQ